MVKRSKKSKSKRMPLRKKYKILKKVKEHHKKKAKEAKKIGTKKAKVEKDPGIPNAWPFREQELQALEVRRARAVEELERKKEEKKERARKRKAGEFDGEEELEKLASDAKRKDSEFEKRRKTEVAAGTSAAKGADGSRRAFYKEFMKVVEASDVVIQVLDARDPLGSRCMDVERLVHKSGPAKRVVLLLNKIDLVPKEVAEKWLTYLREELPTVAFKCSTQQQKSNLGQKDRRSKKAITEVPDLLQSNDSLGAETLLQLLKNYARNQQLKTSITVGIVGFPNVGKSSLINSLKRTRAVSVGATPGVTKVTQEVHLDKHVKLLDSPGIVFASAGENTAAVALRNCIKIEKLEDPIAPVKEILRLCPAERLMSIYKLQKFSTVEEFLPLVAAARGKLKKGGVPDTIAAARMVLQDWNTGKIPYFTMPPKRDSGDQLESAIVSEWGKEFNVDEVFERERSAVISGLPSLGSTLHVEMPGGDPLAMDMDMDVDMQEDDEDDEDENESDEESEDDATQPAEKEEEEEPEPLSMDTSEAVAVPSRGSAFLRQNDKLYDVDGILNPHAKRAEKKLRKKAAKVSRPTVVDKENDSMET